MDAGFRPVIVISDSICRRLPRLRGADVVAYPGLNIARIHAMIRSGRLERECHLSRRVLLVLHLGTNNVEHHLRRGDSHHHLADALLALMARLQRLSPDLEVIFSGILPRLRDHASTGSFVRAVNRRMDFDPEFSCWDGSSLFLQSGSPVPVLYHDGLHLSSEGLARLHQYFSARLRMCPQRMSSPAYGTVRVRRI